MNGPERPVLTGRGLTAGVVAGGLAILLGAAVLGLPAEPGPLSDRVRERAEETGATNPVTAVLLGFRAYDTWLEVAVVLAAVVGVLAAVGVRDVTGRTPPEPEPVLAWMAALVVPAGALIGGLLLWLGTTSPGGAFQAGAVLGASVLLLWLAGGRGLAAVPAGALRPLLAAGVAAFALAAVVPMIAGGEMLEVPARLATGVVIAVEAAVTVTVAVSLPLVVMAVRGGDGREPR